MASASGDAMGRGLVRLFGPGPVILSTGYYRAFRSRVDDTCGIVLLVRLILAIENSNTFVHTSRRFTLRGIGDGNG